MSVSGQMTPHAVLPETGRAAKSLVILLHGLGADGRDLAGLSGPWRDFLPDTVFVAPDAPFACDMGGFGYQWFSLREWTPESILAGVRGAAPLVHDLIDSLCAKYSVPASRTALVGFSQGTMMSLYVAPRHKDRLAGVLGYSGALVGGEGLATEKSIQRVPVCLIHGTADEVIPVSAWSHARAVLESAGFTVTGHTTRGLTHSIDDAGIEAGGEFLKSVLET